MTETEQIVVRPLGEDDMAEVMILWGLDILDDLEILSYDRWGPGIAAPVDESVPEVYVNTLDPGVGMPRLLRHLMTAPDAFCLVAGEPGQVRGYITGRVVPQGVNDFVSGQVDTLYVREEDRRHGVATALVRRAMHELRDRGATAFRVEVNKGWSDGLKFWRTQHWEQDAVVFRLWD